MTWRWTFVRYLRLHGFRPESDVLSTLSFNIFDEREGGFTQ